MEDVTKAGISRRTLVKGAAWSVPVLAAAVAVPMAAASAATNTGANFYWNPPADIAPAFSRLTNDDELLKGGFQATISYRAGATSNWNAPTNETISVVVVFSQAVSATAFTGSAWTATPDLNSAPQTTWTFQKASGESIDLNFNFVGTIAGDISSTATMSVTKTNNPWVTWAAEPAVSAPIKLN